MTSISWEKMCSSQHSVRVPDTAQLPSIQRHVVALVASTPQESERITPKVRSFGVEEVNHGSLSRFKDVLRLLSGLHN